MHALKYSPDIPLTVVLLQGKNSITKGTLKNEFLREKYINKILFGENRKIVIFAKIY